MHHTVQGTVSQAGNQSDKPGAPISQSSQTPHHIVTHPPRRHLPPVRVLLRFEEAGRLLGHRVEEALDEALVPKFVRTRKNWFGSREDGETGRQADRQTGRPTRQTGRQADRHRQIDRQTGRQTDRQIHRHTVRQLDRQTGRIDACKCTHLASVDAPRTLASALCHVYTIVMGAPSWVSRPPPPPNSIQTAHAPDPLHHLLLQARGDQPGPHALGVQRRCGVALPLAVPVPVPMPVRRPRAGQVGEEGGGRDARRGGRCVCVRWCMNVWCEPWPALALSLRYTFIWI